MAISFVMKTAISLYDWVFYDFLFSIFWLGPEKRLSLCLTLTICPVSVYFPVSVSFSQWKHKMQHGIEILQKKTVNFVFCTQLMHTIIYRLIPIIVNVFRYFLWIIFYYCATPKSIALTRFEYELMALIVVRVHFLCVISIDPIGLNNRFWQSNWYRYDLCCAWKENIKPSEHPKHKETMKTKNINKKILKTPPLSL